MSQLRLHYAQTSHGAGIMTYGEVGQNIIRVIDGSRVVGNRVGRNVSNLQNLMTVVSSQTPLMNSNEPVLSFGSKSCVRCIV